jgi:hypothetical protein
MQLTNIRVEKSQDFRHIFKFRANSSALFKINIENQSIAIFSLAPLFVT